MGIVSSSSNLFGENLLIFINGVAYDVLFTCQMNINTVLYFNDINSEIKIQKNNKEMKGDEITITRKLSKIFMITCSGQVRK